MKCNKCGNEHNNNDGLCDSCKNTINDKKSKFTKKWYNSKIVLAIAIVASPFVFLITLTVILTVGTIVAGTVYYIASPEARAEAKEYSEIKAEEDKANEVIATNTPKPSPSPVPTATPTMTPVPTATPLPTMTPTPTPTIAPTPTATPTPQIVEVPFMREIDGVTYLPLTKDYLIEGITVYIFENDIVYEAFRIEVVDMQKNQIFVKYLSLSQEELDLFGDTEWRDIDNVLHQNEFEWLGNPVYFVRADDPLLVEQNNTNDSTQNYFDPATGTWTKKN